MPRSARAAADTARAVTEILERGRDELVRRLTRLSTATSSAMRASGLGD
jgi:hypothetical protein